MKTKVLVTGGAGFLGSHLCEWLIKNNHDVLCIDNYSTGSKDNIENYKLEAEKAEREGNYGLVAEIRYGKIKKEEEKRCGLAFQIFGGKKTPPPAVRKKT